MVSLRLRNDTRLSLANPTSTMALGVHVSIFLAVLVTISAKLFGSVARADLSSTDVFCIRNRLQVVGVAAMPHSAQMVENHPPGERPTEQFVNYSVNPTGSSVNSDLPIPLPGACRPKPAVTSRIYFLEDTIL